MTLDISALNVRNVSQFPIHLNFKYMGYMWDKYSLFDSDVT
jgi:hypothetical protein